MNTKSSKQTDLNFIFQRTEVKYRIPAEKYPAFRREMEKYMQPDDYGLSLISSIYYDTDNSDLAVRSLEKPPYKEKLRLRAYGIPGRESTVFPEIKKKVRGVVYKRRAAMKLREAEAFLNAGIMPAVDSQIIRELKYFRDFYQLSPALLLAYDREAFFGRNDSQLRMTVDCNIRYRDYDLRLDHGPYGKQLDLGGDSLLEIKANGAMPLPVVHILDKYHIYPSSFSKYGSIYSSLKTGAAGTEETDVFEGGRNTYVYQYN